MPPTLLITSDSILDMGLRVFAYTFAVLFSVVIFRVGDFCCADDGRQAELERRVRALHKTVNFMAQRSHQMNVDAVFGLTLTEVHVKETMEHENVKLFDPQYSEVFSDIVRLCQLSRQQTLALVDSKSTISATFNRVLNRPDIWLGKIIWSLGLLGPRPQPTENNSVKSVLDYFYKGSPNETVSDQCIYRLSEDSSKPDCILSETCAEMLLRDDGPRGYSLTHRLLSVQIAKVLRCKERSTTPFGKLVPEYCSAIWQDTVDMEDAGLPAISRDLISEQVLLCGMEGYTEFANDHYARLIMSWVNSEGCYSAFGFPENNKGLRYKRETEKMDFGCDNHATALGAASLSLLIRNLVETAKPEETGS